MIDLFDSIEDTIQENKEEATAIEVKTLDKSCIQEETIQENKQEEVQEAIESSFKHYLKSIIPIQDFTTQEENDSISFNFTIKKSDLIAFKAPKVYSSYDHSLKIKKGQEIARQKGIKPGLKKGSKRERTDKQPLIEQIKKLSNSFNGSMNNHELAKFLNCSLNRICAYKKEIKKQLKNSI